MKNLMTEEFPQGWGGVEAITPKALRKEFWKAAPREWKMIYRYLGFPAFLRSMQGTKQLMQAGPGGITDPGLLDCLTCSVIPEIAKLWGLLSSNAFIDHQPRILMADSSGNLDPSTVTGVETLPLFNFNHGTKLDLLMRYACRGDFVIVCDDDIFWLDDAPVRYALKRFSDNNNLSVVSLHPRPTNNIQLVQYVEQAMGSYCLIIRREIWLKEQLSFVYYKPEGWKGLGNYFDTADFANLRLVQLGYEVEIAPEEVREQLVTFYSSTMWGIRILVCKGEIGWVVNPNRPDEHKKVYRTALTLKGFQDLLDGSSNKANHFIQRKYLDRAEYLAKLELDQATITEVEGDIYPKLERMEKALLLPDHRIY